MRIRFWGVRGSLPAPLSGAGLTAKLFEAVAGAHAHGVDLSNPDAVRAYLAGLPFYVGGIVGGNTTCVEITAGEHTLVVDAGSGIRPLGLSLLRREFGAGRGTLHLFFTHAHWDHLVGFPFFKPAYVPGNRIICYAVNHHPLEYLRHLMTAPTFFPIDPEALPAQFEFVTLKEGEPLTLGPLTITNIALYHPGVAYAYRFDDGHSSFVLATDAEFKDLDDDTTSRHVEFFRNADVLAFDAQFSLKDAFAYEDWGHSSAMIGVDLALAAGVRRLITIHHDPNNTDRQIWEVAEAAQEYARLASEGADLEVNVGYEGLEVFLAGSADAAVNEVIEAGAMVVSVAGRLDRPVVDQVRERLQQSIDGQWRQPVAVDLSQVQSTETGAVEALAAALQAVGEWPLTVVSPAPHLGASLRRLLETPAGPPVVFPDRVSALAAIVGPATLRLQGAVIAGRYRLTNLSTTDDHAALYEARDIQMGRAAVAHVLNSGLTHAARQGYLTAFREWGRLHHPSLQAVLDILPDEAGLTVVILEALGGETVKEYCRRTGSEGRLSFESVVEIGCRLLEALGHMHNHGLAHGELRPEAVYWNGSLKLAVAGVAALPMRGSNAIWLGPSAYFAPERVAGGPASPAADLFAAGLMLYQMLSGVHPFESETGEVTALRLANGAPPPALRTFNPAAPPALEAVVRQLLAPLPAARYASAQEAARALGDAL